MICVDDAALAAIRDHGRRVYPEECCGILLGRVTAGGDRRVVELIALENRNSSSRHNRFLIEPRDILDAEKYGRQKELELVGFYHSHPDCEAHPSRFDLDHAWPWYTYVIVSVLQGKPDTLTCWQLSDDRSQFDTVELVPNSAAAFMMEWEHRNA